MLRVFALILFLLLPAPATANDDPCSKMLGGRYFMGEGFENEQMEHWIPNPLPFRFPLIGAKRHQVKYLTAEELSDYQLKLADGRVYQGNTELLCKLFDCRRIFGIPDRGTILVGQGKTGHFQHSSFFSGKSALAIGTIRFRPPRITYLDNFSGHYTPDANSNFVALEEILAAGFHPPDVIGFVVSYPSLFHLAPIQELNVRKAIKAWNQGKKFKHESLADDVLEKVRAILEKYDYVRRQ